MNDETGIIGFRISYPLKLHYDYIIKASLTWCQIKTMRYFAPEVTFPHDLRNENGTVGFSSFLQI
jgi:hypothetical protein